MIKPYFVTYMLNPDETSITILTFVAQPIFNEIGEYTAEEAAKVVKLLQKQKVPKFTKTDNVGGFYTYKTYEEWGKFIKSNNRKIKKLLNE